MGRLLFILAGVISLATSISATTCDAAVSSGPCVGCKCSAGYSCDTVNNRCCPVVDYNNPVHVSGAAVAGECPSGFVMVKIPSGDPNGSCVSLQSVPGVCAESMQPAWGKGNCTKVGCHARFACYKLADVCCPLGSVTPPTTTTAIPTTSTTTKSPTTTTTASAVGCAGGIPVAEVQGILDAHNALRRSISAGTYVAKGKLMPAAATPIPDMTWDCSIEASAQAVSDTCVFAHSTNRVNLGENLYNYGSSSQVSFTGQGKKASDAWSNEFQDFGWLDIKLTMEVFNTGIGHATQMAWAKSTKIGCGMTLCQGGKQVIVACQYRDQGNYLDQNIYPPVVSNLPTTTAITTTTTTKVPTTTTTAPTVSQCPGGIPAAEVQGILDAHNALRRSISAGTYVAKGKLMPAAATPIPDMTWDCSIEASAQAVSDTCVFAHSTNRVNLGENLYNYMSSAQVSFTGQGKKASDAWSNEFQDFGWLDIKLTMEVFNTGIGHATQMAWAKSTKIGCGMTLCQGGKQVIVACQYRDQGNYLDQNIYPPVVSNLPTTTTIATTTTTKLPTTTTTVAAPSQCAGGIPAAEVQAILAAHNALRASISAGTYVAKGKLMPAAATPIPDMTWDCSIEASAQAVSDTCVFAHSTNRVNLGENLYNYMSSAQVSFTGQGKKASDAWSNEFQDFGWLDIKLTMEVFNTGIGHATQMAWAKSTKIGCGMTLCQGGKQVIVACQYRDQGNYLDQNIYPPVVSNLPTTTAIATTTTTKLPTTTTTVAAPSQCAGGIPAAEVQAILAAHNALRASISSGTYVAKGKLMPAAATPIPDMTWDCSIEASAQAVSDTCVFAHSTNRVNLGENLYNYMSSAQVSFTGQGKMASDAWSNEFQDFGWLDIKLTMEVFNTGIGHATQMAWAKSTKIGCGMTLCQGGKQVLVACQYRDQGNYLDQNIYNPV